MLSCYINLSIYIHIFLHKLLYMHDCTFVWFFLLVIPHMFLFQEVMSYVKFKISKIDLFKVLFPDSIGELTLW